MTGETKYFIGEAIADSARSVQEEAPSTITLRMRLLGLSWTVITVTAGPKSISGQGRGLRHSFQPVLPLGLQGRLSRKPTHRSRP